MMHKSRAFRLRRQRGVILALVLACLFVAIVLSANLGVTAARGHRRLQRQALEAQAAWVAESAVSRALAQWRRNPEYEGETWSLAADEFDGQRSAEAVITVAADPQDPQLRRIHVEAQYPADPIDRVTVTRTVAVRGGD
jgi:type II secretory pathway component PulK